MIVAYAQASGDFNPIHLDDAAARSVGLDGVIAHGMLSLALATRMLTAWAGSPTSLRSIRVRFSGMVKPGDRLSFRAKLTSVGEPADLARLELWAENQDGTRILSRASAEVCTDRRANEEMIGIGD